MAKDIKKQQNKKIVLKEKGLMKRVEIEKITYLKCNRYLTTVHIKDEKKVAVCKLLKEFEMILPKQDFIRVNHRTLVNIDKIIGLEYREKRCIYLEDNTEIPVSVRKLKAVKAIFKN